MHGGMKVYRGSRGGCPRTMWRPTAAGPTTTTWPRAPASPSVTSPRPTAGAAELAPLTGDGYEAWVAGLDPDTGAAEGPAAHRRPGGAVRRGRGQRAEVLVARGRAAPGDRGTRTTRRRTGPPTRSSAGSAQHATTRVGPRGAQVQVPVERDRGGDGAALHLPRRRPAPAPAPADQRPGVRRRDMARAAHGRRPGLARRDQRHRARRGDVRPGVPGRARRARLHPRPGTGEIAQLAGSSARSAPGRRRSAATSTATKPTGGRSIPARSRARRCGGRGTRGRGPRPARTRSCPR